MTDEMGATASQSEPHTTPAAVDTAKGGERMTDERLAKLFGRYGETLQSQPRRRHTGDDPTITDSEIAQIITELQSRRAKETTDD